MWDEPIVGLRCLILCSGTPQRVSPHIDSWTVAMEVGISSGVCNNSPTEWGGLENGWRWSVEPIPHWAALPFVAQVGGRGGSAEAWTWVRVELPSVQILVIVASIQVGSLKTDVGKGFVRTVIEHELGGPKIQSNFRRCPKGGWQHLSSRTGAIRKVIWPRFQT